VFPYSVRRAGQEAPQIREDLQTVARLRSRLNGNGASSFGAARVAFKSRNVALDLTLMLHLERSALNQPGGLSPAGIRSRIESLVKFPKTSPCPHLDRSAVVRKAGIQLR
jgi:hypothetical protein